MDSSHVMFVLEPEGEVLPSAVILLVEKSFGLCLKIVVPERLTLKLCNGNLAVWCYKCITTD